MISKDIYEKYLDDLLAGNRHACADLVQKYLNEEKPDIKGIYNQLFTASLYDVGKLWEENKISVATEHLATSITESLMTLVYPYLFRTEHIGKKAVISCVANEHHQVGGKMVADVFELNGWDGYFLGANTPKSELHKFIDEKKPDALALSLSIYYNISTLVKILDDLKNIFPGLQTFVGGTSFPLGR